MGWFDTCQIFKLFFVSPFLFGKGRVIIPALEQPPKWEQIQCLKYFACAWVTDIIIEIILIS